MNLEDTHLDVIGKALRGRKLSTADLAGELGLNAAELEKCLAEGDATVLAAAAAKLALRPAGLIALARGTYEPPAVEEPEGLAMFTTPFTDMMVNAFLVFDPATKKAAVFDTGTDCDGILETVARLELKTETVFITHTHGDHVYDLDRLLEKTGAKAWSSEPLEGAETFDPGREFSIGGLRVRTRLTWGHCARGTTYFVTGLAAPLALVGDALFAGSMGGGAISYPDAVRTSQEEILSLPSETIICPGHGPLTTVGFEARNNPFFPTA